MNASQYDFLCFEAADAALAEHPHLDTQKNCDELGGLIQCTIDEWIKNALDNYDGPPDPPHLRNASFCDND